MEQRSWAEKCPDRVGDETVQGSEGGGVEVDATATRLHVLMLPAHAHCC